jgi:hypothetical protein
MELSPLQENGHSRGQIVKFPRIVEKIIQLILKLGTCIIKVDCIFPILFANAPDVSRSKQIRSKIGVGQTHRKWIIICEENRILHVAFGFLRIGCKSVPLNSRLLMPCTPAMLARVGNRSMSVANESVSTGFGNQAG